jgi:hypothetical protein
VGLISSRQLRDETKFFDARNGAETALSYSLKRSGPLREARLSTSFD